MPICCVDHKLTDNCKSNEKCYIVPVPADDPIYSKIGAECIDFAGSFTDHDVNCVLSNSTGKPEPMTETTAFMDASLVYGNGGGQSNRIRSFIGGRLEEEVRDGSSWIPHSPIADNVCVVKSDTDVCYQSGDPRTNQHPTLALTQILLLREHNRIADYLLILNPQWDDETVYQEARKIVIAECAHITFYEWLPYFLGLIL